MGSTVREAFGIKNPDVDKTAYEDKHADDLRPRIYAVLDSYIKKHGIDTFMPQESRPYEYLSPEERAKVREQQAATTANEEGGNKPEQKPVEDLAPKQQNASQIDAAEPKRPQLAVAPVAKAPEQEAAQVKDIQDRYRNAAFVAAMQAKEMGFDPQDLALTPFKQFQAQPTEAQQKQTDDLMNFIKLGRRYAGRGAYG